LRPQKKPQPLSPQEFDESKKQIASGWEQQTIFSLLENPATKGFKYELLQGSTLFLITPITGKATEVAKTVDAILKWLGVAPGFNIYIWFRDDPRIIKANQWPTKAQVNGGWTIVGTPNIVIYRSEEWERVLIHEMIHAMKWDWDVGSTPAPCWKMNKTDKLNPHLFEAWTELYAEWLACEWYGKSWEKQRKWQDFQATQLLARAKHKWEENTSVFAYYVLKAALAPHFEFLWVFGNGKTPEEKQYVMCGLVTPELNRLRNLAKSTSPQDMSLRMSVPNVLDSLKR
jgi:hypothetical protein